MHSKPQLCVTVLSEMDVDLGRLYSVDWTRDWTRDWTVGLDSQKVALIILRHQNTTKYLHDMNGIRGSRP